METMSEYLNVLKDIGGNLVVFIGYFFVLITCTISVFSLVKNKSLENVNRELAISGIGGVIGFIFVYGGHVTGFEALGIKITKDVEQVEVKKEQVIKLAEEIQKSKVYIDCRIDQLSKVEEVDIKINNAMGKVIATTSSIKVAKDNDDDVSAQNLSDRLKGEREELTRLNGERSDIRKKGC